MKKHFSNLVISSYSKVIIILDASDSADEYWDKIIVIARAIINRFEASLKKEFFILGNSKSFREDQLDFPSGLKKENRYRGSFISPIMEKIEGPVGRIIIIGAGPIYDIEDWIEENYRDQFLFINLGEEPLCGESMGESTDDTEYVSYINEIRRLIEKVRITGVDFMPFYWDNQNFRIIFEEGKAVLEAERTENFNVRIGYFGDKTTAEIHFIDGGINKVLLTEDRDAIKEKWVPLLPGEADLYREVLKGKDYDCPLCDETHSRQEIRCPNVGILGRLIYESFEGKGGILIFRDTGDRIEYLDQGGNAALVSEARVAAGSGGTAHIFEFDSKRRQWKDAGVMEQYLEASPGLRIVWL